LTETSSLRAVVFNRRILICVFTGFLSGLPLYLLIQLVPAWLRVEGVSLKEIGFFALIQFPYTWKFLWAPLFDRYTLPFLGRRRGWMFVVQLALVASFVFLGQSRPAEGLVFITIMATIVALFSASQDIVLDAYRRELLTGDEELGLGNSVHTQTYRLAGLVPGSLGLVMAGLAVPWDVVFAVMAAFMAIGLVLTLVIDEAVAEPNAPRTLREAIIEPFVEFFTRQGPSRAILVLMFMLAYKLGDSMATALSTPFYIDLGFEMTEIGIIAKNAGLWPSIIGGILGGLLIVKVGINKALWLFGVVQIVTILGFVWLAEAGDDRWVLAIVVAMEYLGVGLGTAAFVGFIARETNPAMAATQFALFTALAAVPRTAAQAATGVLVEAVGWTHFFLLCTALAVPGMVLLFWVAPFNGEQASRLPAEEP